MTSLSGRWPLLESSQYFAKTLHDDYPTLCRHENYDSDSDCPRKLVRHVAVHFRVFNATRMSRSLITTTNHRTEPFEAAEDNDLLVARECHFQSRAPLCQ